MKRETRNEELEALKAQSRELEATIVRDVTDVLET